MAECHMNGKWRLQVTALYDYEPEESDELGFQEGDVLQVLQVQDDGWWFGYNVREPDVKGLFPSNYVQAPKSIYAVRSTKSFVDEVTTPKYLKSSPQRIKQQLDILPDTPLELKAGDEGGDEEKELQSGSRGHARAILQLRQSLEEAERRSEIVRDARQQAERGSLRQKKSWREREHQVVENKGEGITVVKQKQQFLHGGSGRDTEDEDVSVFLQRQSFMHGMGSQEADMNFNVNGINNNIEDKVQTVEDLRISEMPHVKNTAATFIARSYRQHIGITQTNNKRKDEVEHKELRDSAVAKIARAYSKHRKLVLARQRENEASINIQKWIRMRWACFWCKRARIKCQMRDKANVEQLIEKVLHRHIIMEKKLHQVVKTREEGQELEQNAEKERTSQQTVEAVEQQLCHFQLENKNEKVQLSVLDSKALVKEEEGQHDTAGLVITKAAALTPDKCYRKIMKKETVKLIKLMVQQQLDVTLRDHDTKMGELQSLVASLQTVVRKQTTLLEDSTNQLVKLQLRQQETESRRSSGVVDCSFLPRITEQSSNLRQTITPSGLRAPRPVVMSRLPVFTSGNKSNRLRF